MSQVTVETLSEDILLNVFRHLLAATPRFWPILAKVCRRWKQIVFASPLGLNLRLYFRHRTPVLKSLDCWPVLPINIQYGGVQYIIPPSPSDDDNIIAALKQSSRINSISLTVTSSLLKKLSAISEPLLELQELVLRSQDDRDRTLPSTFLWGPRLRILHLTRIAIPSFLPLLLTCQDLVELQLHEFPGFGYFSPEAFANALSGTPQLRSLTLQILSFPPGWSLLGLPPRERIVLAALTHFKYRGTSQYLDIFVARIDSPHLGDMNITFFHQRTMDASQLGRFIERVEMHTSLTQADVQTSAHAISISFTDSSDRTPLRIQISCKQLDLLLPCMAQVCDQISPFLSPVIILGINAAQPFGRWDDVNSEQWLDLLRSFKFSCAKSFWVADKLTTAILGVLGPANEGNTAMLPSLCYVRVLKRIPMGGPLWDSVQSFITARWISGRPIELTVLSYECHICDSSSTEPQELKLHLRNNHGYQILCSYCGKFECTPERSYLFRSHLQSKHPEIARNDSLISKPSSTRIYLDNLVNRHGSLRAPDVVPSFPMSVSTELHSQ